MEASGQKLLCVIFSWEKVDPKLVGEFHLQCSSTITIEPLRRIRVHWIPFVSLWRQNWIPDLRICFPCLCICLCICLCVCFWVCKNSIPDLRICFLKRSAIRFIQNDLGLQTFLRTSPRLRQQQPLRQHHPHQLSQYLFTVSGEIPFLLSHL